MPRTAYALTAFGLLLRILGLAVVQGKYLQNENPSYDRMGLQLGSHVQFSPYWPPGVPYYLLFFHKLFGEGMLVARASMLLPYVCFCFALYALIQEICSRRAANLAVLAFALYPSYIRYAFNPSTEYPAAACLLISVSLTILVLRRPSYKIAIALGFVLGALALIRPSSIGVVILISAFILYRTRKPGLTLALLLCGAVLVSAWLWKAYTLAGRFVMINDSNAQNLFFSNNPYTPLYLTCRGGPVDWTVPVQFTQLEHSLDSMPAAAQQVVYRQIAVAHILSRPDLFLLRTFNRFRAYFCFPIHRAEPLVKYSRSAAWHRWVALPITILEVCFFWPIMVLAIICLFNLRTFRLDSLSALVICGVALAYAAPSWLTCSQPRYNFPVVPLFATLAFAVIDQAIQRPCSELLKSITNSVWRRRGALFGLALFFYIQAEWMAIVASAR